MQLLFPHRNYYRTLKKLLLIMHALFCLILFLFEWNTFIPSDTLGKAYCFLKISILWD